MRSILKILPLNTDAATLLLRLVFGGIFVYYGYSKILAYDKILPQFGDIIGIGPKLSFHLVIFAEFGCGLLIALGFLTRLAVIPVFITMAVAYFIAHAKDTFEDKELSFLFLLLSIVVFLLGSGKISIDHLIFKSKK